MNKNSIVVSSRVRLARNLKKIPFPAMLKGSRDSAEVVLNAVRSVCDNFFDYEVKRMDNLSEIDRIALLERHIISPALVKNIETGVLIKGESNGISIMINEEDHIRAQCVMWGYGLEECYNKLAEFDDRLSSEVELAYEQRFGYLTACPTNLGTGMRASIMLFLPALTRTGDINKIIKSISSAGLTVRGAYGEGSDARGFLYQISNQQTIGLSEQDILVKVEMVVDKICDAESLARNSWYKGDKAALEDKVMRSFGVLLYSRKISSSECMELLSNVKLGLSLGIIDLNINMLNALTELVQPANLCHIGGQDLNQNERDMLRAKLIREKIQLR